MTKEDFLSDISRITDADTLRLYLGTLQSTLGLESIDAVYKHYGLEKPKPVKLEVKPSNKN